jgi:hypothetical protein
MWCWTNRLVGGLTGSLLLALTFLLVAPLVSATVQTSLWIGVELTLPNGVTLEEMEVPDGGLITIVETAFWPTVEDPEAGVVSFILRAGTNRDGRILEEFEVVAGAPAVQTDTQPSFGVKVTKIEEREEP